jgi:hypothetical protein
VKMGRELFGMLQLPLAENLLLLLLYLLTCSLSPMSVSSH